MLQLRYIYILYFTWTPFTFMKVKEHSCWRLCVVVLIISSIKNNNWLKYYFNHSQPFLIYQGTTVIQRLHILSVDIYGLPTQTLDLKCKCWDPPVLIMEPWWSALHVVRLSLKLVDLRPSSRRSLPTTRRRGRRLTDLWEPSLNCVFCYITVCVDQIKSLKIWHTHTLTHTLCYGGPDQAHHTLEANTFY